MKIDRALILTIILVLASIAFSYYLWVFYMVSPWTRDARVHADISHVASQITGKVKRIHIKTDEQVNKDQLLFELEGTDQQIALDKAIASLERGQFQLKLLQDEKQRLQGIPGNLVSEDDRDKANTSVKEQQAQIKVLTADLSQAKLNLERTKIYAPHAGYISDLDFTRGQVVTPGQQVMALIDLNSFSIKAYFEETRIKELAPGQKAKIRLMGRDDIVLKGTVVSIARGINNNNTTKGSQQLPDVQQTFPWIRLAQRVPVTIVFDDQQQVQELHLFSGSTASVVIE
ncbi:hypothetical protein CXF86_13570 [Shewanella sp. GutCb]|uniref:efflux RND transporter periplasmic adaptor subunit n=1 Tax=Shewanella sp. GutCb TaxID=2058315 RepID=UPI000C7D2389|nr:HlyD family secretion protein [Shewanella sp. GutCb]PKG74318.1 hypothetical protein CXF86_13570 [Shewanella sp. GutCb]